MKRQHAASTEDRPRQRASDEPTATARAYASTNTDQVTDVGTLVTARAASESRALRRPLSPSTLLGQATPFQRLREYLFFLELRTAAENLGAELDRGVVEKLSPLQRTSAVVCRTGSAAISWVRRCSSLTSWAVRHEALKFRAG